MDVSPACLSGSGGVHKVTCPDWQCMPGLVLTLNGLRDGWKSLFFWDGIDTSEA